MKKTTSKQVKRKQFRRKLAVGICTLFGVIVLGGKAYGLTGKYGDLYLTYSASITSTKGTSTTSGAPDPYLNYASLVIYDKDGASKGTTYTTGKSSTTASLTGSNFYKNVSYHAAVDSGGAFLYDFRDQIIYTVTR